MFIIAKLTESLPCQAHDRTKIALRHEAHQGGGDHALYLLDNFSLLAILEPLLSPRYPNVLLPKSVPRLASELSFEQRERPMSDGATAPGPEAGVPAHPHRGAKRGLTCCRAGV